MFNFIKTNLTSIGHHGLVDRVIEDRLVRHFRKQKDIFVKQFYDVFIRENPTIPAEALKLKLENEAERVCNFTDRAIVRGNIKRAKYSFWIAGVGATFVVIATVGVHTPINFVSPLMSALLSYIGTIAGITALYKQRVKGAMVQVVKAYIKEASEPNQKSEEHMIDILALSPQLSANITASAKNRVTNILLDFIPSTLRIQNLLGEVIITISKKREEDTELNVLQEAALEEDLHVAWENVEKIKSSRVTFHF
jgi:hypothetical protein